MLFFQQDAERKSNIKVSGRCEGEATRIEVIASMVGQALKVDRLVDSERQRLRDENLHLKEELRERYDFSQIITWKVRSC